MFPIEGLFLSSAVIKNPDHTMEQLIGAISILRNEYKFNGYIHAKTIPGASEALVTQLGLLADRISVNIELPSEKSLQEIAPQKTKQNNVPDVNYSENEQRYRDLWREFYNTVEIKERHNEKCRMSNMPKRYRKYLTEMTGYSKREQS